MGPIIDKYFFIYLKRKGDQQGVLSLFGEPITLAEVKTQSNCRTHFRVKLQLAGVGAAWGRAMVGSTISQREACIESLLLVHQRNFSSEREETHRLAYERL